jgi:hypothetical protein
MSRLRLVDVIPPLRYFELKMRKERDAFCVEHLSSHSVKIIVKKKKVVNRGN